MATKATIRQNRYDKSHMRQYLLKMHLEYDNDIIQKLASVPSMQGYIKQLIREDLARTRTDSVPKNAFYDRVIREQIIDTEQYRYIAKECHNADEQWVEIRRLPLNDLDTTAAIDGWETVKIIK